MFDFDRFFRGLKGLAVGTPLLFVLFLMAVVVFAAAPFLYLYRSARTHIPGAANVLPVR